VEEEIDRQVDALEETFEYLTAELRHDLTDAMRSLHDEGQDTQEVVALKNYGLVQIAVSFCRWSPTKEKARCADAVARTAR
jgi:hypothetical protein